MAPRLKILMASGSKKRTQIYFSFLSKVPANELPPGSSTGPLWRERPIYRTFCISLKNLIFRVPQQRSPPSRSPAWNLQRETLHPHVLADPQKGAPLTELPQTIKVPGMSAPHIPGSPRVESGPHAERCPQPETFLTCLPASPVKELPPRPPPNKEKLKYKSFPFAFD